MLQANMDPLESSRLAACLRISRMDLFTTPLESTAQYGPCEQVIECFLPFGEGHLRGHCDLALAPLNRDHTTTQVSGLPVHLDALLKKLLLETTRLWKHHSHTD